MELMPDYETDLPTGSTLLLNGRTTTIVNDLCIAIKKAISNPDIDNIIWICYHKVPDDIIEHLAKMDVAKEIIDKIQYVDMMSNMLGLEQKSETVCYCSTPTEYNCLLRSVDHLIDNDSKNLVIFDNINALMSYDMIERMIRFIRNLNNLLSSTKCPIIYLGISGGSSHEIEVSIYATMDNIYNLQGNIIETPKMNSLDKLKSVSWTDVFTLNSPIMFILFIVMMVTNIFLLVALSVIVLALRI